MLPRNVSRCAETTNLLGGIMVTIAQQQRSKGHGATVMVGRSLYHSNRSKESLFYSSLESSAME